MSEYDWLIVGAGFAGSVLAERLAADAGQRVLVVDRRDHIGGNAFDMYDAAGVLMHRYGPHIFHTNSEAVSDYLSRFTDWRPYEHRVLAAVDGQLVPIPINLDTVNRLYGLALTSDELEAWFAARAEPVERIRTSEDVVVSKVGRELYEKFFRGYTRKQWGLDPSQLDKSVTSRVPVRTNRDDRYFGDSFQAMPAQGYTRMFERMLDHPNIEVRVGTDFRALTDVTPRRGLIYTGAIDEFFVAWEAGHALSGGSVAAARGHFQAAVRLSNGMRASAYVTLAEAVPLQSQDAAEFTALLNTALAIDPGKDSSHRQAILAAQRRARWLLSRRAELFNEPEPKENPS